jgi:hypothetical protein
MQIPQFFELKIKSTYTESLRYELRINIMFTEKTQEQMASKFFEPQNFLDINLMPHVDSKHAYGIGDLPGKGDS